MPKAIVLGAGMVGSVIAADLAATPGFDVTVSDIRPSALAAAADRARSSGAQVRTLTADLADPAAVQRLVAPFDIVLGALASRIGLQTLRAVIDAGKHYCDISFMAQDATELDALARSRNVTAIVDMGVAPGMSNLLAGAAAAALDPCEQLEIYVGGLPTRRHWPFQYKAAFSPADVIEEYTRPARIVEHHAVVVRPALSEPELMDFTGVGTLEAFNTDGLRSLAYTLGPNNASRASLGANSGRGVPFMKEKTLRYPGHIELMRVLRETGLFSENPIEVRSAQGSPVSVRPLDLTSRLLFPKWTYEPGEPDLTVMRVIGIGRRDGRRVRLVWDVLDFLDPTSNWTSMARTTAFPCTIAARLIAGGTITSRGVLTPEELAFGPRRVHNIVETMLSQLAARGVKYTHTVEPLD